MISSPDQRRADAITAAAKAIDLLGSSTARNLDELMRIAGWILGDQDRAGADLDELEMRSIRAEVSATEQETRAGTAERKLDEWKQRAADLDEARRGWKRRAINAEGDRSQLTAQVIEVGERVEKAKAERDRLDDKANELDARVVKAEAEIAQWKANFGETALRDQLARVQDLRERVERAEADLSERTRGAYRSGWRDALTAPDADIRVIPVPANITRP